jgi:hypothetical protein
MRCAVPPYACSRWRNPPPRPSEEMAGCTRLPAALRARSVEPLGDANHKRQHRRDSVFDPADAALDTAQPSLHRREAGFESGEAMFQRGQANLDIANFGGKRHNPCAKQIKTDFLVTHLGHQPS